MDWTFPKYTIGQELDWDDLSASYSWIQDMKNVPQDPIWHAEGDVFTHTRMVVDALINFEEFQSLSDLDKHILVTAALLHDVEKRSTTTEEVIDGKTRIISPRHAKKGEFTARAILYKEIKTPFAIRERICKLVRLHGLPLWIMSKSDPDKEAIYASTQLDTAHLAMLAKADIHGRISNDEEGLLYKIDLFRELCKDNNCYGQQRVFKSNHSRYLYFNKTQSSIDYDPYDDLICTVYVMSALPGSGKDTYIKKNLDLPILSLDDIRREHKISATDKKGNGQVIQMAKEQAKVFLRKKDSFVFNATNITSDMRSRWIKLFTEYNARVKIIYIEVPFSTLLKQNSNREHPVPVKVIEKLISKLEIPTIKEAHDVEYVISE